MTDALRRAAYDVENPYLDHAENGESQCQSRYGRIARCTRGAGHLTEMHTNWGALEWTDDDED